MSAISTSTPKQRQIWSGAILGSIAHAIFTCRCPELSHEQSWDGSNYNVQDSAGSRGTIAFSGGKFVAVFFYDASDRNSLSTDTDYDLKRFFTGMPSDLQPLAQNEALQYVLQEFNDATVPVITSAFWGDGVGELVSCAENWDDVLKHGAILVRKQLLDADLAISEWTEEYALEPLEIDLTKMLFSRKMASPDGQIQLNQIEQRLWENITMGKEGD